MLKPQVNPGDFLAGIFFGLLIGIVITVSLCNMERQNEIDSIRKDAIINGYGTWVVDPNTGKSTFVFKKLNAESNSNHK